MIHKIPEATLLALTGWSPGKTQHNSANKCPLHYVMCGNVRFHTEMPIKATSFQAMGIVQDAQFTIKMDIIGPPV